MQFFLNIAWSKQNLLNAWIEDPIKCCEKCGISTDSLNTYGQNKIGGILSKSPTLTPNDSFAKIRALDLDSNSVIARKMSGRYINKKKESANSLFVHPSTSNGLKNNTNGVSVSTNMSEMVDEKAKTLELRKEDDQMKLEEKIYKEIKEVESTCCHICMAIECDSTNEDKFFRNNCSHRFCRTCWENYLTTKIDEGAVNDIVCPQVDCFAIIPPQVVESLISKETAQRYIRLLIHNKLKI